MEETKMKNRLKELENMAWLKLTGEEIVELLRVHYGDKIADEYNRLAYGDDE